MRFTTPITVEIVDGTTRLVGPHRVPAQMLEHQEVDDHTSIHDEAIAASLGLSGAPIEAPTHFSQIDPLAVEQWGSAWFERGTISCHFRTMVVDGEQVQATLTPTGETTATVEAHKPDGTPVLTGTAGIDVNLDESELGRRLAALGDPGELFIIDQLRVGMRIEEPEPVTLTRHERHGAAYPFSLAGRPEKITEHNTPSNTSSTTLRGSRPHFADASFFDLVLG